MRHSTFSGQSFGAAHLPSARGDGRELSRKMLKPHGTVRTERARSRSGLLMALGVRIAHEGETSAAEGFSAKDRAHFESLERRTE